MGSRIWTLLWNTHMLGHVMITQHFVQVRGRPAWASLPAGASWGPAFGIIRVGTAAHTAARGLSLCMGQNLRSLFVAFLILSSQKCKLPCMRVQDILRAGDWSCPFSKPIYSFHSLGSGQISPPSTPRMVQPHSAPGPLRGVLFLPHSILSHITFRAFPSFKKVSF